MTVRRLDDGTIVLEGDCLVEDAEALLQQVLADPAAKVDWTSYRNVHTAVVQVLLASLPRIVGPCSDPWIEEWVTPLLAAARDRQLPSPA